MTKVEAIKYWRDMLKAIKRKKASPGNGFAKAKCVEKLAELGVAA